MESHLAKLLVFIVVYGLLGYFLTRGIFEILKVVIDKTKGSLHVLFIFGVIIAGTFAMVNKERAPEYLEKIQFWKNNGSKTVYHYGQ